jgi:superfamily I DNA/RNA helicase
VEEESSWLINEVQTLLDAGYEPREIAVFARTRGLLKNRASAPLRDAGFDVLNLEQSHQPDKDAIRVGTMHRAKGMEFRAVFVVGCEQSEIPSSQALASATDDADREELREHERHLLYVACTRARDRLFVSWVGEKTEFLE